MEDIFDRLTAHIWISPDATERYLHFNLLQNIFLNGDHHQKSASSSTLMDQAAYLELPSVSFCPTFQGCNLMWLTMTTFILKPCLKHNEKVFPAGKNRPGMESVAGPLNILNICFQRKEKQFSNFHQKYDIPAWTNINNSSNSFSFLLFEDWKAHFWNELNIRFCIQG